MARKNGNAQSRQPQLQPPMNAMMPVGIVATGGNGVNSVLKLFGVEECPECKRPLDLNDNRPLRDFCGHMRCRRCLRKAPQCDQCKKSQHTSPVRTADTTYGPSGPPILASSDIPDPTRTYPPHVRVTSRCNKTVRFLNGLDRPNGCNGLLGGSRLVDKYRHPDHFSLSTSTTIVTNTSTVSSQTVKASKSFPNGTAVNNIPFPYTTPCTSETPTLPSDDPTSSLEMKNKKKKKRNPVVIQGHITVISGEPTMFQCNVCMRKFKTKAHIKYHDFCMNGEKQFQCEECGQGFVAKSHYEYHLRTHTGELPYACSVCGKGFKQRGKVTRHMRSHTGEKPFVCDDCGRGFANAQALRSHHLIHTGERPFACEFCNKRFTGMTNLKKHIITHTGERSYVCPHCGKSFGSKWTLDLHLRTHSSERPHACDQCTRAFSNTKDLRRHLVIHSGERPFKCRICLTAFRRKDNLERHIKNTHNQPEEVAKQLANEAAAEYLAINANSQVPASKVNSAVISNVIRRAQLNRPTANIQKEKGPLKPATNARKKKSTKSTKKSKPFVLSDVVEASVTNAVIITTKLSPRDDAEKDEEDCNDLASNYFTPCSPTSQGSPTDDMSLCVERQSVTAIQLSPRVNEDKMETDTFENYISPDTEDSLMEFASNSVTEEKLHTDSTSSAFIAFASESDAKKLHPPLTQNSSGSFIGFDSQSEAGVKLNSQNPSGSFMFPAPKYTVKGFLKVVKNTKKELLKGQKRQKHCSLRNRKLEKVNVTLTSATDWTEPSCRVLQKTDWTTSIILRNERVALPGSVLPCTSIPLRSLKSISTDTKEKAALVLVVRGYQFRLKFSSAETAQKYRQKISGRRRYLSKEWRQKSASSEVSRKSSLSASEVGPTTDEELKDVSFPEKKKRRRELGKSLSSGSNDDGASWGRYSEADRLARRRKRERRDTEDGPATASNK